MNKNKIILIIGLIILIIILGMNTGFAAKNKSETFTNSKSLSNYEYQLNISTCNSIVKEDSANNYNEYYKFKIKKNKQKNYRIKSIEISYENINGIIINRTYNGYKKTDLIIKLPSDIYSYNQLIINYHTNTKIKNEVLIDQKCDWYRITHFKGKTANMKSLVKGYYSPYGQGWSYVTYNKFKITTKGKYYIKGVLTKFREIISEEISYELFKGHGKRKLIIKTPKKHELATLTGLRIYYY